MKKEIEIFDDENTISSRDDFAVLTLEFFPKAKKFKSTFRVIDDAYYRKSLYEYKLSAEPIEVTVRLIEQSAEPPLRYAVRDGVVLESEIQMEFLRKDFIDDLKKDVEWHKLELVDDYVRIFYILSKHPEIVSKFDYKKFLRQTKERIKSGLLRIEKRLKDKDDTGLQIIEGEHGKLIWYSNIKDIPKEECAKKIEYTERNFYAPLFDEKSPDCCGISKSEFENSSGILEYIEKFLNENEATSSEKESGRKKNIWRWLGFA